MIGTNCNTHILPQKNSLLSTAYNKAAVKHIRDGFASILPSAVARISSVVCAFAQNAWLITGAVDNGRPAIAETGPPSSVRSLAQQACLKTTSINCRRSTMYLRCRLEESNCQQSIFESGSWACPSAMVCYHRRVHRNVHDAVTTSVELLANGNYSQLIDQSCVMYSRWVKFSYKPGSVCVEDMFNLNTLMTWFEGSSCAAMP